MSGVAVMAVATSAVYLGNEAGHTAAVRLRDADEAQALAEVEAAIEHLERARRALRGW